MKDGIFDLTPEQEETSKMMYNGKIIKCLVAPYHSYQELESIVPYTKTTFLYPEKEMSGPQCRGLINAIVNNPTITDEVIIITKECSIILDMIDACVRILTESGNIVDCPIKTFMANIHDIRYKVLENDNHRDGMINTNKETFGYEPVNEIISIINDHVDNNKTMTQAEFDQLKMRVKLIGEDIISSKLLKMISRIEVSHGMTKKELLEKAQEALDNQDINAASKYIKMVEKM